MCATGGWQQPLLAPRQAFLPGEPCGIPLERDAGSHHCKGLNETRPSFQGWSVWVLTSDLLFLPLEAL